MPSRPIHAVTNGKIPFLFLRLSNITFWASHVALIVKNLSASAREVKEAGLIPGSGRSPGGGHGNPLQYSCLEKPMDRGAWWATIHMVAQSDTTEVIQHARMYNITFYLLNNQSIYIYIILSLSIHLLMDISAVYREWRVRRSPYITKYQLYKVS